MSTNKTIIKNTMFLYFRMFFSMGVSLYTSRVVLETLGVEDFGIYNLVGGIVILFSFLNNSMNASTQRFINYNKTSNFFRQVNKIFNLSLKNHFYISLLVLLLSETVGLWFLNNKLNIPLERMYAANVIYQISIFTACIDIVRTPFNAVIIAYEKMQFYAYVGIFETLSRLGIVFLIQFAHSTDKLILYCGLYFIVNQLVNIIYFFFCKKNFRNETKIRKYKDKGKIQTKELLLFSGWMLMGQVAVVGATQGLSMILNIFHGVVINASLGIANQVNGAVYNFVSNFQVAFNPQIVQSYAAKDYERNKTLILSTSKISFFLIAVLSAPILFCTHDILTLWLGKNLPMYVEDFIHVVIFCSLIDALAAPFWMSAGAIGIVKEYNITLTIINLFTLPIAYILLKLGYSPIYAFWSKFFIYILLQIFRYYFINKRMHFEKDKFLAYLLGVFSVFGILYLTTLYSNFSTEKILDNMITKIVFVEIILLTTIVLIGINKNERQLILNLIKKKLRK